jgi:hypothetical protein
MPLSPTSKLPVETHQVRLAGVHSPVVGRALHERGLATPGALDAIPGMPSAEAARLAVNVPELRHLPIGIAKAGRPSAGRKVGAIRCRAW